MNFLVESVLFSYAQIFFSNRKWFGLIILLVSLLTPKVGFLGLFGVITANLIAYYLKFDTKKIRNGFYGFNAILFGAAVGFFYELSIEIILLIPLFIVITFLLTTVLEHYLAVAFNLPGLSLPFIISFYFFSIFLLNYNHINYNLEIATLNLPFAIPEFFTILLKSLGLIILQPTVIAGIVILITILFFSRILFLISLISYVVNYYSLQLILPNQFDSLIIISSLNSILVGFALGASLIIPSRKSLLLAIISIITTVITLGFFHQIFLWLKLPIFVLPFNFVVLMVIYSLKFRKDHTDLTLLYFSPGSPEENYYYHHNQKERFNKYRYIIAELPFFGQWKVSQGFNGQYTHKNEWRYAWDFVSIDEQGKEYQKEGLSPEDYYCYDLPVTAPLDGEVVKIVDKILDNPIGEVNIDKNWGNTIVIKHSEDFYSAISHLKEGSFKVKVGDKVKKGTVLAKCGNSGRSPYPHIHFQFQLTDKIGEKTFKFPFGFYISESNNNKEFKIFDYPNQGELVKNLETHKIIKNAFDFKLGNKFNFVYSNNDQIIEEEWEVKVDIFNLLFIENNFGEIAYFNITDKVFYFTSYIGKKNSALYYFYLSSPIVPFTYEKDLLWNVPYPITELSNSILLYLNELLLFFKNFFSASGVMQITENEDEKKKFSITSNIRIQGNSIFKFYAEESKGELNIDRDGKITQINFIKNNKCIFEARTKNQEKK